MRALLAIGDCNLLGAGDLQYRSYPERVAEQIGCQVKNCGYTMSTTREGLHLLADNLDEIHDFVIIQFGLVDSYVTFRFAPYIKYYPDNFLRKQLRSIVKKYKKTCRKNGLNAMLGEVSVVPESEYLGNIDLMVVKCAGRAVILPETIPHHDEERNCRILRYNSLLAEVASRHETARILPLYDEFSRNMDRYYSDKTHASVAGYDYIAEKIVELLQS